MQTRDLSQLFRDHARQDQPLLPDVSPAHIDVGANGNKQQHARRCRTLEENPGQVPRRDQQAADRQDARRPGEFIEQKSAFDQAKRSLRKRW